jgi:hypothetical protein
LKRKTNITITLATLLLSLVGLFAPIAPVNAVSANVAITPSSSTVPALFQTFTVSVAVTNVQNLNAYDISISFDESQLQYVSTSLAAPWQNVRLQKFPGSVREAAVIFAGGSISAGATQMILLNHTFRQVLAGTSVIHIATSALSSFGNPIVATTTDGIFVSSEQFEIRFNSATPASDSVNFNLQSSMDIIASVHNDGTTSGTAFVAYRLISGTGTVFGIQSNNFALPANSGTVISTTTFLVDPVPDTFGGVAAIFYSMDGVHFQIQEVRQLGHGFKVIG